MTEEWRPVPGWEDRYEVSNVGRVRGLMQGGRDGGRRRKVPYVLSPCESGPKDRKLRGQKLPLSVRLCRPGQKLKFFTVHKLVLLAFRGPPGPGQECRHLNDDRHDNRLENLAWGTKLENAADARRNGIRRTGTKNGRAKLNWSKVRSIRKAEGRVSQQKLADKHGVTQTTISAIQRGKIWLEEER